MLVLILGIVAIAGALGLGGYLVLGTATSSSSEQLIGERVAAQAAVTAQLRHPEPEAASSLFRRMAAIAKVLTPASYAQRVQHKLDLAGNPRSWGPDRVLSLKGLGLVGGVLLGLVFGAKHGGVLLLASPLGLGAFGFYVPDILVRNLGEKRQLAVQKALPDSMDMLTVCVEAGLGFDAALGRVARNLDGAMAEEAARVLQEMQFGMSRAEALRSLLARTDVPELRAFVSAVIQSTELGISIGDVLREQASEMRVKRRQRAEEKAQKLQIKLLLPLVTCLLPAMFVVILGPAVIQLVSFFTHAAA